MAATDPPLFHRTTSGHIGRFEGIYVAQFNPPIEDVDSLSITVLVNDEAASTATVTRTIAL
jgi:hypothetical protein